MDMFTGNKIHIFSVNNDNESRTAWAGNTYGTADIKWLNKNACSI